MENKPKRIALIDFDSAIYSINFKYKDEDNFAIHKKVVDDWISNILTACEATHYLGFLGGKTNFRYQVAVSKEYKSNRLSAKPKFFYDLRDYVIREHKFLTLPMVEAEDGLSLFVNSCGYNKEVDSLIICHIDKDCAQIPGRHYNFMKNVFYDISQTEGDFKLFGQVLSGDSTDSIPGLRGIGPKKAEAILNKGLEAGENLIWTALKAYVDALGEYEGIVKFTETYRLVKLIEDPINAIPNFEGGWNDDFIMEPVPFIPKQVTYNFNINDFIQ